MNSLREKKVRFKGIVMSFPQKNRKKIFFFGDCNLSSIRLYVSVATS